jgi:hypothetical protein
MELRGLITHRQMVGGDDECPEGPREALGEVVGICGVGLLPRLLLRVSPATSRLRVRVPAILSIGHLPFSQQKVCVGFGIGPTAQELSIVDGSTWK